MSKTEILWVPLGTTDKVQQLAERLGLGKGRPPRSPGGRLMVIERQLNLPRKKHLSLWIQIIINPWEFDEMEPVIDLLNVDSRSLSNFRLVDNVEGRFRYNHRSKWKNSSTNSNLRDWFDEILQYEIADALVNVRTRPSTPEINSGLRFPHGVRILEEQLLENANKSNFILRTESEHEQHLKLIALEDEKKRQEELQRQKNRKLIIEKLQIRIRTAESLEDLDGMEKEIPAEIKDSIDEKEILNLLNERREQLQPKLLDFPEFDDPSFTTDSTLSPIRKKKRRGIREFDNIG